jgi:uncharacterized protein (TIRG00374 family)
MAAKKAKSSKVKMIVSLLTIVALFAFVYALRHQIVDTFQNLKNVNLWAIALMPLLQAVNYHAYTKMYQQTYLLLGDELEYKKVFRVQLELNFVNNVFPSGGVSGISYFGLRMRSLGASAGKSTLVQVIKFGLIFLSFQVMLAVGLLTLAIGGQASNFLILIAASLSTFLFVGTLLAAYIIGSRGRINSFFAFVTRAINKLISYVRRGHPETIKIEKVHDTFNELHDNYMLLKKDFKQLKKPFLFALLANATEVLTIYAVYMAFGQFINPGAVIIAYAVSNFAGLVSVLPGGVGVYEAIMTATLVAAGIPAALSLPVTIMYRILNSFIQLPIGAYYYYKTLHARQEEN